MVDLEKILASIKSVEELNGFADMIRDPPPGVTPIKLDREGWTKVAHKKIALKRKEAKS